MKEPLTIKEVSSVAKVLKILAHPTRIKIVEYLENEEKNVTSIQDMIGIDRSGISQHLKKMYVNGILRKRRDGVKIYYRVNNQMIKGVLQCIRNCRHHEKYGYTLDQ
ncbi:MAG: winged helix-turn-helix transcriptional regulator [Candidatus Marinimicrobia bacterium]|nr:winged helix-turn-helix transcriptional regulator [Candidatus Neomarinimicrobiota bacterium]